MVTKKSNVERISTTIIKPSSPTPNDKKYLKLSLLDQTFYKEYGSILYFYNTPSLTSCLHKTLSKTLELFYPFAGQFNDDFTSIKCNDHGAYFLEARIDSELSDLLLNPDPETVGNLLPSSDPNTLSEAAGNNAITLVQITMFSCGGVAISVEVSHKIADGFSISCFAKTWAAITAGNKEVALPVFLCSALHPPQVIPINRIAPAPKHAPLRSRRFIFSATKLADLKKKIQENGGIDFTPSTIEAISSLLLRSITIDSGDRTLVQMVNMCTRLTPSLPDNCIGNFAWPFIVPSPEIKRSMELHEIAAIFRKELSAFFGDCREYRLKGKALGSAVSRFVKDEAKLAKLAGIGLNWVSFMNSLGLYETDFGWGKPMWVTSPLFFDKVITMIHSKSGQDIEVWATFEQHVMEKLETNQELLSFASVDVPKNNKPFWCSKLINYGSLLICFLVSLIIFCRLFVQ